MAKKRKLEWTLLHTAAQQGDVAKVRELLAAGADPNAREHLVTEVRLYLQRA